MSLKPSKAVADNAVRIEAMQLLGIEDNPLFERCSNQSFGVLVGDGTRYCEIRFIARATDEELTARELLDSDIAEMKRKQAKAAQVKAERAAKAEKDKKKRADEKAKAEAAATEAE